MVHVDVHDPEQYEEYRRRNGTAFSKYGARFLVRGGRSEIVSGTARARHVIIEFKDFETARACFFSPEYQEARTFSGGADFDTIIVEALDGPPATG
jgi:uncharacterized protein (DUF1330 family)